MTITIDPQTATKPELIAACRRLNVNPRGGLTRASKADLISWVQINHTGRPLIVGKTTPDAHGRIRITTTHYVLTIANEYDGDLERSSHARVYVDNALAEARSAELVELTRQEENLGDNRFLPREVNAEVDTLYDRLNAEIMRVKLEIAREALPLLSDLLRGDMQRALDGAEFKRDAGCSIGCPCSPGVVTGAPLWYRSAPVAILVDPLPVREPAKS